MNYLYRFVSGALGIYEAVERDCPRNDVRRHEKPDGSWLRRVGNKYLGAISFWTERGLLRYRDSGLLGWHCSVVIEPVKVLLAETPCRVFYGDEYQVICHPRDAPIIATVPVEELEWPSLASGFVPCP